MSVAETIERKVRAALNVTRIEVIDESARHAGHAGAPDGGESHFMLLVISPDFVGKTAVARQREIYHILADEMAGPIHALSLDIRDKE